MSIPATRMGDFHVCHRHDGEHAADPVDHAGNVMNGSPNVTMNGRMAVKQFETVLIPCMSNFVRTGASTVCINGKFTCRMGEKTADGDILTGSDNVHIGGPSGSGCPREGASVCAAAAAGRHPAPGSVYPQGDPRVGDQIPPTGTRQSYHNCGVECCRQILNAFGGNVTQEELLKWSVDKGYAHGSTKPDEIYNAGGTQAGGQAAILNENGVPAEEMAPTMDAIIKAAENGQGVIVPVWGGTLWPPLNTGVKPGAGPHGVVVTGFEYGPDGQVSGVILNDTGLGTCGRVVPIDQFKASIMPNANMVVTKGKAWSK